jgi:hypothetical protein
MNDFQTTTLHFNGPQSNSVIESRWVLPGGQNILGASLKVNDLILTPNVASYFPVQSGVYACVSRVQLLKNKKLVSTYTARSRTPVLLSSLYGSNDAQKVLSVLSGTGNVVRYDPLTKLQFYERPVVGVDSAQIELRILLDILNHLTVINDELEIRVTWITQSRAKEAFVPISAADTVSSFTINSPYLTFETLNKDMKQPDKVVFNEYIEDSVVIPAGAADQLQNLKVNSNAFIGKTVNHLLVSTLPSSVVNLAPSAGFTPLFRLHTTQMSIACPEERFTFNVNGADVLGNSNSNDAIKFSFFHDVMKMKGLSPIAISNAHISKTAYSIVNEIPNEISNDEVAPSDDVTGYYSYMAIQLNKRVNQFITINYQRQGQATYEEFDEQLSLRLVAEVPVSLVGDVKSYL